MITMMMMIMTKSYNRSNLIENLSNCNFGSVLQMCTVLVGRCSDHTNILELVVWFGLISDAPE